MISEVDTPQKPVKASKKENVQPAFTNTRTPLLVEKTKAQMNQNASFNTESVPLACIQGLNDNSSTMKSMKHDVMNETQHQEHCETNYMGNLEGSHGHKGKLFDGFHMSYYDAPLPETGVDHHQQAQHHHYMGDGTEYTNYMFVNKEFDPFGEMLNSVQGKHFHLDDSHHNTNAFLYPKGFNVVNPLDDKMGKTETIINYEEGGDNCPLRGLMDSQNLFRTALRKASFFSIGGNSTGYRKDSMDLF